jgi:hypothetical protein
VLAAVAFGVVAGIRLYYYKKTPREVAVHKLEIILLGALAFLSYLVGIWFVSRTRVIWEDSVLVGLALILHFPAATVISWIGCVLSGLWKDTIFVKDN